MESRMRREPIRSTALRRAAKGQRCTLNFPGICSYDAETVVLAHISDETRGGAIKSDDTSAIHACFQCHTAIDTHEHGLTEAELYKTLLRALQRTIRRLVIMGEIQIKQDKPKPASERPVKPRKPKAERKAIQNRTSWATGRKLQSRNDLKRTGHPVEG